MKYVLQKILKALVTSRTLLRYRTYFPELTHSSCCVKNFATFQDIVLSEGQRGPGQTQLQADCLVDDGADLGHVYDDVGIVPGATAGEHALVVDIRAFDALAGERLHVARLTSRDGGWSSK